MNDNRFILSKTNKNLSLGRLKILVESKHRHISKTAYICAKGKIYAVLHTDTEGWTRMITLPARDRSGTEYDIYIEGVRYRSVTVYPFVINIHYISIVSEDK